MNFPAVRGDKRLGETLALQDVNQGSAKKGLEF